MTKHIAIVFTTFLSFNSVAHAWGSYAHQLIAEQGAELAGTQALQNCHITKNLLVDHVTDPDLVWRSQRLKHPNEATAHFFDVDKQPKEWRSLDKPKNPNDGYLVFRIIEWTEKAKELKKSQQWNELSEKLYGLAHYLGDLTQPLHLTSDYDGYKAGLPKVHAQFEQKMIWRYRNQVRSGILERLHQEKIPAYWKSIDYKSLIFNTAEQGASKVDALFKGARPALQYPSRKLSVKDGKQPIPRFVKPILWKGTGTLAMDQIALGARLVGYMLMMVCQSP